MLRKAEEPFDWQGPELTPAQLAQVKAAFSSMRKMEEESQCFQLFPVDRELPAEILARTAVWNWVQKGGRKPSFLFTAQMFGSGKVCIYFPPLFVSSLFTCPSLQSVVLLRELHAHPAARFGALWPDLQESHWPGTSPG